MESMNIVNAQTLKTWLASKEAVVIDVRSDEEFATGHIPGALHLPVDRCHTNTLPSEALEGKKIVFQCKLGKRGERACQQCQDDFDAKQVWNLEGGIEAWIAAGYPLEG
jgi:rhodanese-related sulfurtransferase